MEEREFELPLEGSLRQLILNHVQSQSGTNRKKPAEHAIDNINPVDDLSDKKSTLKKKIIKNKS